MMTFLLILLIVLSLLFFSTILLPLLPFFLLVGAAGLIFHRPSVRVYTRTFNVSPDDDPFASMRRQNAMNPRIESPDPQIEAPVIDAEYSETDF